MLFLIQLLGIRMRRGPLMVILVLGVLLAGCAATTTPETTTTEPTDTTRSGEGVATSECCTDGCWDPDRRDRPEAPSAFTQQTAVQFVETYRNATLWNEYVPRERVKHAHVSVTGYLLNETATGYLVHIKESGGTRYCDVPHGEVTGTLGITSKDYFVNESMLAVLNDPTYHLPQDVEDHPPVTQKVLNQNWTIVERWNRSSE